jgi:hypothetical protein
MSKTFKVALLSALAALCVAGAAAGAKVTGTDVTDQLSGAPGQQNCTAFKQSANTTTTELADFNTSDNTYTNNQTEGPVTITNVTSTSFDFTSTTNIAYVLVHTGGQFTLYDYTSLGGTFSDTNLSGLNGHAISGVTFCTSSGVAAARLRSVTARLSARTLNVRWQTASEIDVAGYNVFGVVNGHRTRLNAHIIASKGSNGHRYSFTYRVPRGKRAPSRILLQVVNLDGTRQWSSARVAS